MKIDNAPQDLDPREKELLFGIYNRMQDIRENYTGENLKKAPILRPGETLDDFDVTFRKPNAAGGIASLMSKI